MPCLLNSLNIWSSFKADKCLNVGFWLVLLCHCSTSSFKTSFQTHIFPQCPLSSQVWGRAAHAMQGPFFHSLQSAGPFPLQGAKTDGTHLASQHQWHLLQSIQNTSPGCIWYSPNKASEVRLLHFHFFSCQRISEQVFFTRQCVLHN